MLLIFYNFNWTKGGLISALAGYSPLSPLKIHLWWVYVDVHKWQILGGCSFAILSRCTFWKEDDLQPCLYHLSASLWVRYMEVNVFLKLMFSFSIQLISPIWLLFLSSADTWRRKEILHIFYFYWFIMNKVEQTNWYDGRICRIH